MRLAISRRITATTALLIVSFFCNLLIVHSQPIDLSRPVGMTPGEAGNNGVGGASYTIPIEIPSGVKGLQPKLNLNYVSQGGGDGFCGYGWALSATSAITRAGRNVFHNGISTPVQYTGSNDAFVLDGQRLMLISGSNGADGSVYGTEKEGFSRIEAIGGDGNSPVSFKVTTKDGTILEYGTENTRLVTNDGLQVIFWLLRKVTDASGNYMLYNYDINASGRYYSLSSISYTGNQSAGAAPSYEIRFTYLDKANWSSNPTYISGSSVYTPKLLNYLDVKKADGTQIRRYAMAYQYRQKKYFLTSVTESGADGSALNPISFTYGENTTASNAILTAENGYSTNQNFAGDFDGDGRQDVLTFAYRYNTGNGETFYRWYQIYDYNNGSIGGKYSYHMDTDIPNTDVKVMGSDGQNPFTVSDFDGDGKEDVFLAKFNTNSYTLKGVNINYSRVGDYLGTKYVENKKVAYDALPYSFYGTHTLSKQNGTFYTSGDFDGDGFSDYILILGINGYSNAYKAFFSSPAKGIFNQEILGFGYGINGDTGEFAALKVAESRSVIPINFDGDAKTELLVVRDEGSYVISIFPVPASTGYQYGSSVLYSTSDIRTDYRIYPGDFNGDGNTDLIVRPSKNNPGTAWKFFFSTGKVFNQQAFTGQAYTIILPGDGYSTGHMLTVGDYDGDGKSDLCHAIETAGGSSNQVFYSFNGSNFEYEITSIGQPTNTESSFTVGDFNGDGKPDFLKVRNVSSTSFNVRFLMLKPFQEKNLLVGVNNLGYQTNFDYSLLNGFYNTNVYSRTEGEYSYYDGSWSSPYVPAYIVPAPSMYVVSNILRPNGVGYQSNERFNYQDLIVHTSGRGALGFKRLDVIDDRNVTSRVWNTLDLTYSLLYPDVTQTSDYSFNLLSRSRITTTIQSLSTSYFDKRYFVKTDKVHSKDFLTNIGKEITNTYDNYGNITESVLQTGVSSELYAIPPSITDVLETVATTTVYGTYSGAPYPGFPTSVTVNKTRAGSPAVSKVSNYVYTANGLISSVTDNAGTPLATTVNTTYNGFGLPVQITTSAPGVLTPVSESVFDNTGKYVLENKVTGGGITRKTTFTYDDRWDVPLSETSTDGLTTTYVYNTFGDLIQTNFPDGNSVSSSRSWVASGITLMCVTTQRTDGSMPVRSYLDILGREIKTEKRGFGNQWITTLKNYNYLGQVSSSTSPYYPGEQVNYTYYYYDTYGRPTYTTSNVGSLSTSYVASGGTTLTVSTTNSKGQTRSQVSDASGKMISSSENGHVVDFTYDSWGNQVTASGGSQPFVTHVYDSYGRKTSTTDVNAGTVSYQYNSLGQLVQQTDAVGNVQNMTYDIFNRLSTKSGTQGTTTYSYYYDAGSGYSNDNITQIIGFNGDVRSFSYDGLHRLSSETITAGGSSLTKSYTYDGHGNMATTSYPAGFQIRNIYDDNDIIIEKRYEAGGVVKNLFTATEINSRGMYTGYSTGNGKTRQITWDYTKDMPTRFYTAGVQDLNLNYENYTLNLLSRADAIKGITEEFAYDNDDRLVSARVNGAQQFNITYDDGGQGKILQKSDVGNYNYDVAKIHALQYLTPIDGGTDPTGIFSGVKNITYTPYLKTASITYNGYQQTYSYGYDHQRISSELQYGGATVESKSYWENIEGLTKGGNKYEIYYISAGNGLNNIIVKQGGVISIYYTYPDQLGSIVAVTDEAGSVIAEQNFDAWGRKRNPANWTYAGIPSVPDWLFRGFTGHEHIEVLALINMNGRMYDPYTGQMLAPDNYIPLEGSPGGYNRYNYANSNPLKFKDPSGDFWNLIIGAVIGGVVNLVSGALQGKINSFGDGLKYFGIGAAAGALGAGVAGGMTAVVNGGASFGAGFVGSATGAAASAPVGFLNGALVGASSGAASGFALGLGNALGDGNSIGDALKSGLKGAGIGVLTGGVVGGVAGGITALKQGRGFWDGFKVESTQDLTPTIGYTADGGQNNAMDCGPQTVVKVQNEAYGGPNITRNDVRGWVAAGTDPDAVGLPDITMWNEYGSRYGRQILSERQFDQATIVSRMNNGYKVAFNQTTGELNMGHSTLLNVVRQQVVSRPNGSLFNRIVYNIYDPARGVLSDVFKRVNIHRTFYIR